MVIRKAREYDMSAIVELCRESLITTFSGVMEPEKLRPWAEGGDIEKYVRGNWPDMLVAWQGEKLAGLAAIRSSKIDLIWVAVDFRQQGVGGQLMEEAEQKIAEKYSDVSVECLLEDESTKAFYQQRGYECGREYLDGMTGVQKVIMTKSLAGGV